MAKDLRARIRAAGTVDALADVVADAAAAPLRDLLERWRSCRAAHVSRGNGGTVFAPRELFVD